tara:strand:- start:3063 stop:3641 length:579 start_codon:yes stop_codon:yes gene_type:complete
VVSRELSERAFEYINSNDIVWYGPRSKTGFVKEKKMRASFGRHDDEPDVPEVFREIGLRTIQAITDRARSQHEWGENETKLYSEPLLDTLILNLYDPGDSVAAHCDPPRQDPAVMGITFCEATSTARKMRFRFRKDKKRKHDVLTADRSAYLFFGDAYTDWTHESVGSKLQKGRVLSLTFRAVRRERKERQK